MFYIKGKIKDDKINDFVKKDGTKGEKRTLYIEPFGSIYPVSVNVPLSEDFGKIGADVDLKVHLFLSKIKKGNVLLCQFMCLRRQIMINR